jgi:hypothetical protein
VAALAAILLLVFLVFPVKTVVHHGTAAAVLEEQTESDQQDAYMEVAAVVALLITVAELVRQALLFLNGN